jgi:hypothetical protein
MYTSLPLAAASAGASSSLRRGRAPPGSARCRRPAWVAGEESRRREKAEGGDAEPAAGKAGGAGGGSAEPVAGKAGGGEP